MVVANGQATNANDALSHIDQVIENTSARLASSRQWATSKASTALDKTISPDQRRKLAKQSQSFAESNPRLAAFIAVNLVLTGIPVLLFLAFSVSVFFFSVVTALVIGLVSALVFTATSIGVALCILFPTIFFTTIAAALLFAWGLVGFTVLRWASNQRSQSQTRLVRSSSKAEQPTAAPTDVKTYDREKHGRAQLNDPKQTDFKFSFQANQDTKAPAVTALPVDDKLTSTIKHEKKNVEVPTAATTGMVAS